MKTYRISNGKNGFTLMELMVAMAITTIIVTVLVSITSIALDTWNRSRAELRASRQAKSMLESMANDLESLVVRKGNNYEWLSAVVPSTLPGDDKVTSSSACRLIFFTAATDRYEGQVGDSTEDKGGDVSCVAYSLDYNDPINENGDYPTFILKRLLINPDEVFGTSPTNSYLGREDLAAAFVGADRFIEPENFVCENIYQFTVTFHLQVATLSGTSTTYKNASVSVGTGSGRTTQDFKIRGTGNEITSDITGFTSAELSSARITAVEVATTVISDFGIEQMKRRTMTDIQKAELLNENSYQYSKLVQLPSM